MGRYRIISILLVLTMMVQTILCNDFVSRKAEAQTLQSFDRQTINFNREWKFARMDAEGAEAEDYNDSSWYNVGIPHDFSIPYWQEEKHYTGYGWYRKVFDVKSEWIGKRLTLDFEGVFHTAEVYVNGEYVDMHEGGYTGFEIDITDFVRAGSNTVAVRVSNLWRADLAPRAGEHMFTGGIYRDVELVVTSPVHMAWYGTFVQTPDVDSDSSKVRVQAEVTNGSSTAQAVTLKHTIYDSSKKVVTTLDTGSVNIAAGDTFNFDNTTGDITGIKLWSPETPDLYSVHTEIMVGGASVDQYDTTFGFRWFEFDKDEGFFLNGEHYWIDGTNAHQDHAGWANAVTVAGLRRDVAMIKEAGLNFIRGSHYPHSPAYADACDEYGLLFWSEAPFWTTAAWGEGPQEGTSNDYKVDGYPTTGNRATEEAFEQSCMDAVYEMIRINRNHPSIIVWSMGNEPFFGDNHDKKKALVSKMAGYAKELDPTRYTALGGTQGGEYDHLPNVDIAGYNGDGADKPIYMNPGVANMVAEYSSHSGNRPDTYTIFYGSVQTENGEPIRYPWRSGIALWCAFHHGSILSRGYGDMGIIDYYRLPLNMWYYYRNNRTGVEPEFSRDGTPARLSLTASDTTIKNDGTSDTHIIVTVVDEAGNWVNNEPSVTFEVIEGPGFFPTGKTMNFKPGDSMRDGKAAIEFRSYYAGTSVIEAYSSSNPEIEPATITITTTGSGSVDEPDITTMYGAFMSNGGYVPNSIDEPTAYKYQMLKSTPMNASSGRNFTQNMIDNDNSTSWTADVPGSGQWIYQEIEHGGINLYKARLTFNGKVYPYKISYKTDNITDEEWIPLKEYDKNTINQRPYEEDFGGVYMRYIRIEFTDVPANEYANIAELRMYGIRSDRDGYSNGIKNLSDEADIEEATDSELTFDLENDAKNYARFQSTIELDKDTELKAPVTFSVYCDEELIFERVIGNKETTVDIDISINDVKSLKLCAESDAKETKFTWKNARLIGVLRDISRDTSTTKVQICPGMTKLVSGELALQARFNNKSDNRAELAFSAVLYTRAGNVVTAQIIPASVPGKGSYVTDIKMNIPDGVGQLDYVEILAWDKDTLVPVTEDAYIFDEGNTAGKLVASDTDSALLGAIGSAMQVIYAGDAAKYTADSRKGFTEKLINATAVLNKGGHTKAEADIAAQLVNSAKGALALAQTNNVTPAPPGITVTPSNEKPVKGNVYTVKKFKYKVTKLSRKLGEVTLKQPVSRKMKSAVIPAAVTIKGVKCKVTAIADKAFANNKKLKKVVIGKNIKTIGKKAFYNDKALAKVIFKSTKLKKISKAAFAKTSKKLKIQAPKKKLKVYKKLVKKSSK